MMSDVFSIQVLTKKLSNLNNSQQSIETLSRWCILHRKRAKQVVETWDTMFNNLLKEKGVSLMYLANDILQNSRRKGNEFVNEFWKVLPGALKCIYESGDDREKNVVTRLVDIWEERKVFGSRGQTLKDEMLGKDPLPSVENNEKSSQAIKIVKKDANSIRIKLPVGCLPEKIVSAFRLVHDEESNEESVLTKCKASVEHLGKMEGAFDTACAQGNQESAASVNEFLEQETILKTYIEQLETLEAARASLVSHLKEAISEQESKWGDICRVLQVAKAKADYITNLGQKLTSPSVVSNPSIPAIAAKRKGILDISLPYQAGNMVMQPSAQSTSFSSSSSSSSKAIVDQTSLNHVGNSVPSTQSTTFANSTISAEDQNKKTAAEVAAKLASMTSSAQVLTSVISTLVAEEAASMNGGLKPGSLPTSSPILPPTKRPKLEKPMQIPESTSVQASQVPVQPSLMPPVPPVNPGSQPLVNPQQLIFPPLPPTMPSSRPQIPSYSAQSSGGIAGAVPYSFGGNSLSPPPPPPTHVLLGLMRSGPQSMALPQLPLQQPQPLQQPPPLQQPQHLQQPQALQQQPQQQMLPPPPAQLPPPPMQQQQSAAGFFPTSAMGFYGQPPSGSAGPSQSHQR